MKYIQVVVVVALVVELARDTSVISAKLALSCLDCSSSSSFCVMLNVIKLRRRINLRSANIYFDVVYLNENEIIQIPSAKVCRCCSFHILLPNGVLLSW